MSSGKNTLWNICVVLLWMASTSTKCGLYLRAPFLTEITSMLYKHSNIIILGRFQQSLLAISRNWETDNFGLHKHVDLFEQHVAAGEEATCYPKQLPSSLFTGLLSIISKLFDNLAIHFIPQWLLYEVL